MSGDVKASTSVLNVGESTSLSNHMPSNIEQVLKGEVGYYYQIYLWLCYCIYYFSSNLCDNNGSS